MQKKRILLPLLSLAVVFFMASAVMAKAEDVKGSGKPSSTPVSDQEEGRLSATATQQRVGTSTEDRGNSTSTVAKQKREQNQNNDKGQSIADLHRSNVASFVQNLLDVADREGGIGTQVRAIAQAQNESKDKVAEEIKAVDERSAFKTFFIGSDWKPARSAEAFGGKSQLHGKPDTAGERNQSLGAGTDQDKQFHHSQRKQIQLVRMGGKIIPIKIGSSAPEEPGRF